MAMSCKVDGRHVVVYQFPEPFLRQRVGKEVANVLVPVFKTECCCHVVFREEKEIRYWDRIVSESTTHLRSGTSYVPCYKYLVAKNLK